MPLLPMELKKKKKKKKKKLGSSESANLVTKRGKKAIHSFR